MRTHGSFHELPITAITPAGWLRTYLQAQAHGLTGHLHVAGFPFNTKGWASPKITTTEKDSAPWWPYEQYAYWVDSLTRLGHLLQNKSLLSKAAKQFHYVLTHASADGYLGPKFLKPPGQCHRWPHAIFFRALIAEHSATRRKKIISALTRHYLASPLAHRTDRNICNIEIILWLYSQTADPRLLRQALNSYAHYNRITAPTGNAHTGQLPGGADTTITGMLSNKPGHSHGVTYNELCKLPAIIYKYTGQRKFLDASVNAFHKIDKFHLLVDGVPSSTEQLRTRTPLDSHETCDIADYTHSLSHLLLATGQAQYADKIERACFNAAPGSVTNNFKALQYFSCPNQVIADRHSNHNLFTRGGPRMSYRPNHDVACCIGQVNRIMPNFAARTYLLAPPNTIVAALYSPSQITTHLGSPPQKVTITQATNYPFSQRIDFIIKTARPVRFTLALRIPTWCRAPRLFINDKPSRAKLTPATFAKLTRTFNNNDHLSLFLPMPLKLTRWPNAGLSIEQGPLIYALPIAEHRRIAQSTSPSNKNFPALNLYPASPWNYALALNSKNLKSNVRVVQRPLASNPWTPATAPVELHVPARKVRNWKLLQRKTLDSFIDGRVQKIKGRFTLTPPLPDPATLPQRLGKTLRTIRLIPYGCTNLRITIFPRCPSS